jgi:hypothetical protein
MLTLYAYVDGYDVADIEAYRLRLTRSPSR